MQMNKCVNIYSTLKLILSTTFFDVYVSSYFDLDCLGVFWTVHYETESYTFSTIYFPKEGVSKQQIYTCQCTSVALGYWLKHLSHALNNQLIRNTMNDSYLCRVVLVVVGSGVEPVTRHPPWSRDDTCCQSLLS